MQDYLRSRLPSNGERYIYMNNDKKAKVIVISVFRLYLGTNIFLNLKNTFIVLSFR